MRKKIPHFHASSSLNMAVREGWTRCARPSGSPLTAFAVCPTGCHPLSNPRSRVLIPPFRENINEKSPYFRTSSHLEYGGEGGMDSLRSPYGQPVRYALRLSNWLRQLSNPQSRVLITPAGVLHAKKKPAFSCELFFKYGGEGGMDSLRSPFGQPTHCVRGLSNWLLPVVEPSVEGSHPSLSGEYKRKKPVLSYELSS